MSTFTTPYRSKVFESGTGVNATAIAPVASANKVPVTYNDYLKVTDVDINEPSKLASKYVDASILRDKITPILDDTQYHSNAVNYNYSNEPNGLGAFTPFERTEIIDIPDEILKEYNKVETVSNMGIFPEISRAWVTIDNKLILWNLKKTMEFQTFEDIEHTILKIALVKPKPKTFTDSINYLLLISTPQEIHILGVGHSSSTNDLELFNTGMIISTQGLSVDQFISFEKTGQIFFTGAGDGLHIWELQYSNSEDWLNKKCNKRCSTRSTVSSFVPGSSIINSIANYFTEDEKNNELVKQILVDNSRSILYTLSNQSVIRCYKITGNGTLDEPIVVRRSHISTFARTSNAKNSPLLGEKYLKIVSLQVVSRNENEDLFLVAITIGGCRLYLNGSSNPHSVTALRLESVKFPPTKITQEQIDTEQRVFKEQEALKGTNGGVVGNSLFGLPNDITTSNNNKKISSELPTILSYQKKSSVLLESKSSSKIISPGIFFDVVEKKDSNENKLFVTVPDYGILKYHNQYVENSTFLECSGQVHQIVPLSSTFNATDRPQGYANEFATQYISGDFEVAVLTNTSLQIYRFRKPDLVFESLVEDFLPFVNKYGIMESTSTALYVTCKYNISKTIRSNAFSFFTLGIPNIVEFKPRYVSSNFSNTSLINSVLQSSNNGTNEFKFENVILSPRFYGIVTLIGRLFREIWDKQVFQISKDVKYEKTGGELIKNSIFENEFLNGLNIDQSQIEFFLSSISVLNEFFQTYGNSIACFIPPSSFNNKNLDKSEEFANQAENIAINSIIRLIISIKEALSFLVVLLKEGGESEIFSNEIDNGQDEILNLRDIFKYLSLDVQISLSKLKFKDLFSPNDESKNLIKEILSSIINRSMSRGESIEYIAKGLQERCGSFCSANDVVGFRAIEHLRKAKEIGFKDYDGLNYHLSRAIELFEAINNEVSVEKVKESIDIMIGLNDYPRAIKFALNISNALDKGNLANQYILDGKLKNDDRVKYYNKRIEIFEIVFQLLEKIDKLTIEANFNQQQQQEDDFDKFGFLEDSNNNFITDFIKLRDFSYEVAFKFNDKLFHYEFYDWFLKQDISERLLEIDTPFILEYLEEKSQDSLEISDLLWIFRSKRSNFYEAALISYSLALSDFNISLSQRNEYLSRAIGFCNCTTLPNQRQQVIELSTLIEEVFEASNIQYDLLVSISYDHQLIDSKKDELIEQLNGKILTVSELFNDFADVLGYHEICLNIFKVSDFRNSDEILSRWSKLFESIKFNEETAESDINGDKFISSLYQTVIKVGKKLNTSEFVFPINELFPIIMDLIIDINIELYQFGDLINIFLESGVSFDKLYYILKELIDTNTTDENYKLYTQELKILIKKWYDEDIRLREIISSNDILQLTNSEEYKLELDPINNYILRTGNSI
ncbi:Nucleoporin [Wickerhamomyces ciferrii]|uniref:Nucleoporin n=1 Tax=Wickerhamomyces ciferrii (strain ATCC 14091 / BCRC 22168 / CBS 111 / JCM 3599 / NBRC 0793 / NRRL Y-1031 F-60-10) TaxID=1206466 RepID=K0KHN7_WICCF|nr:Nucleoporin [Wickerhamomyces ciferrii]CCH44720.1 Nucleoporin [Wickerhamomyces ciferrii]